jgi:hypothetical protein
MLLFSFSCEERCGEMETALTRFSFQLSLPVDMIELKLGESFDNFFWFFHAVAIIDNLENYL